jgi:hypothetical protein
VSYRENAPADASTIAVPPSGIHELLTDQEIAVLAHARAFGRLARQYANRPECDSAQCGAILDQLIVLGDMLQLAARRLEDPLVARTYDPSPPIEADIPTAPILPDESEAQS